MLRLGSKEIDLALVVAALMLSVIGILLIYSAKMHSDHPADRAIYIKQIVWLALGFVVCALTLSIPLRFFEVFSYVFYLLSLITLVVILVVGTSKMGAARWISLGGFNIQPSEFAKIATIFPLARYLAYSKRSVYSFRWLVSVVGLALLPALLILRQPDLGTSLVFFAILFSMIFWSGVPLFYLFLIVSPIISLICGFHWISWGVFFLVLITLLYRIRPAFIFTVGFLLLNLAFGAVTLVVWNKLHDYQKQRIIVFLDPGRDPQGAGYQIIQSKIAIGSGGLAGKGYLEGSQTKLAFLPHQHTDFVYSVLGEEFGFLGAIVMLGLFAFLVVKGILIAQKTRNTFASNVAIGLTAVIGFQTVVNIGMTLGIMPVTGLPLPLVSYGGSSMLASWTMLGILLAINSKWYEY
jgi:rod shape determining protein RodA